MSHANSFYDAWVWGPAVGLAFAAILSFLAHWNIFPHHIVEKSLYWVESVTHKDLDGDGKIGDPRKP